LIYKIISYDFSNSWLIILNTFDLFNVLMSRLNQLRHISNFMEMLLESIAWIALGFVPTLLSLGMSWRMGSKMIGKRRLTTGRGVLQQQTTTIGGLK
jgi:hypothetical protein